MRIRLLLLWVLAAAGVPASAQTVKFTFVPPLGSGRADLRGIVKGVDTSTHGVVVYINVFGTWWVKPTFASQVTSLDRNGRFRVDITTGDEDRCAQLVAAYVIPLSYTPPLVGGFGSIPAEIETNAIAKIVADRTRHKKLEFSFDERLWKRKDTGKCIWGPGPNSFSKSQVRVDRRGLHLTISKRMGDWQCAEASLADSLGYGTYRFFVEGDVSNLPDAVVLGLFTYSDDADYAHREIDVEFSNGSLVGAPTNWQYVVQPHSEEGHRFRFSAVEGMQKSIHEFTWAPGRVDFRSYAYRDSGEPVLFQEKTLTNGIPVPGNEVVHVNLWLNNGISPGHARRRYEVLINHFEFVPPGSP